MYARCLVFTMVVILRQFDGLIYIFVIQLILDLGRIVGGEDYSGTHTHTPMYTPVYTALVIRLRTPAQSNKFP